MLGLEDGLVSSTGAVVGVAAGSRDASAVALAGAVVLAVEALSMAAGQFLSERTVHQLEPGHRDRPVVGAAVMFFAYLAAGLVPVGPVLVVQSMGAVVVGAALAFPTLFLLGWGKGLVVGVPRLRSGLEVLVIGGVAASLGIIVGVAVDAGS